MQTGVSTHIHVYKPLDRNLLSAIKKAGFETVELYANHPHWPGYADPASRRQIAQICIDLDLPVNSVHSPFFRTLDDARAGRWLSVTARDNGLRRESVERIVESAAVAEFVPVQNIVVHIGAPDEQEDGATFDRLFYSLEEILAATQGLGITVALENITNDISRGSRIARFLTDSDLAQNGSVGCCYDCGHAAIYGVTVEEFQQMAPWLATTHIHDTTEGRDNHLMPFEGDIDWDALASAFAATPYDGALIIETKDDSGSLRTLDLAAAAAARLRDKILEAREKTPGEES